MRTLLCTLLISLSSLALAQRGGRAIERFDQDKDERLSKTELAEAPRLNARFDEIDSNRDGFISREELAAFRAQQKMNKNCDGQGPKGPGPGQP
jgi:hypothetical protein